MFVLLPMAYPRPGNYCKAQPLPSGSLKKTYEFQPPAPPGLHSRPSSAGFRLPRPPLPGAALAPRRCPGRPGGGPGRSQAAYRRSPFLARWPPFQLLAAAFDGLVEAGVLPCERRPGAEILPGRRFTVWRCCSSTASCVAWIARRQKALRSACWIWSNGACRKPTTAAGWITVATSRRESGGPQWKVTAYTLDDIDGSTANSIVSPA